MTTAIVIAAQISAGTFLAAIAAATYDPTPGSV